MRACTAVPRSRLAEAKALATSFAAWHPGERLAVLVTDAIDRKCSTTNPESAIDAAHDDPSIEWLGPRDLSWPMYEVFAVTYDPEPFSTVVAPVLIRHLLERGATSVLYLDVACDVVGRLGPIGLAAERFGLLLWPRRGRVLETAGVIPDDHELLRAGPLDPGVVAVSAGAAPFLQWWQTRAALMRSPHEWVAEAAALFPFHWQRPGPLSPWDPTSSSPIVRLDRLDPRRPWVAAATQPDGTDVAIADFPLLVEPWRRRAEMLANRPIDGTAFGWHHAVDGQPLDVVLRGRWAAMAIETFRTTEVVPPSLQDRERLGPWMAEVDPDEPTALPRFLATLYRERLDLSEAFPDVAVTPDARRRLLHWAHIAGVSEGVPADFLPPAPTGVDSFDPPDPGPGSAQPGVLVAGFLAAEIGLGMAGRLVSRACERAGLATATFTYRHLQGAQQIAWRDLCLGDDEYAVAETVVMCLNWAETPRLARTLGPRYSGATRRVGVWFWELDVPHPAMADGLGWVDEVWVTGEPALSAVRSVIASSGAAVEVHVLPLGVELGTPTASATPRLDLGLPEGFLFLVAFDYASSMERKNPLGAIEAFMKAFPDGSAGGPTLVIKSLNGEYHRGASAHLSWACGDRSDIIIVNGAWSVADTHALAETADAVISLHRAEGYGLWLLEALALGKPVIATDHPGNRAFMTPENSWLVSAKAVPTPDDVEPYNVGATWLEPDVDAAAELLRTVYDGRHSHLVLDRRARAQADVAPLVDGRAAAMFVRSRLIRS